MKNDLYAKTCENGDIYEGEWKDGKKDGKGIYYWMSGSKYEGEFKNDVRHGYGVYYWPDGELFFG